MWKHYREKGLGAKIIFIILVTAGPQGPAVQNNYVELCALFLFTLPLVGIYATPVGA